MYLSTVKDPHSIITAIDTAHRFPEILAFLKDKYKDDISLFVSLVDNASSTSELLRQIRSNAYTAQQRMSLLKMFRRCVSPILDTEMSKKIKKVSTDELIQNYGDSFKDIKLLKKQIAELDDTGFAALAALIGEYDTRGQAGYILTDNFFDWFERQFSNDLVIEGPRGAGRDIELSSVFSDFQGSFPCDFIIRDKSSLDVLAIGFARYDSTRGGAQSDDRTGGNANKVEKAKAYCESNNKKLKIIFLSDGPGMAHKDTWEESLALESSWDNNVIVSTLKTADQLISVDWIKS